MDGYPLSQPQWGTKEEISPTNTPGGRVGQAMMITKNNILTMFGGGNLK
jgi:hypothetical protein